MKILHIASLNSAMKNIGVARQMQYELNAANSLSIEWDVQLWAGDSVQGLDFIREYPASCRGRLSRRKYFFSHLKKMSALYDVILLRYIPCDPFLPFFRSSKSKIIYYHHTKETHSFKSFIPGARGWFFSFVETLLGFLSISKTDGIVAVTSEILDYEQKRAFCSHVPNVVIPNGIDYCSFSTCEDRRSANVKIMFTASSFFSWHGLTEILSSFLCCAQKNNIELHIVGEVFEKDLSFIREHNLEENVFLHGFLSMPKIKFLMNSMDVGLASFSLGEANLTQACTLKVREYLAAGLPVYSGHVDSGLPEDFKFYKIGPPDISLIANFALESRVASREEIRNIAKKHIDKAQLVNFLYEWINSTYSKEVF